MSSVGHLVNRQDCLKKSFDPDAALNYAGVNPKQLAVVTVDLFYISTWNKRLFWKHPDILHETRCQNTMLD